MAVINAARVAYTFKLDPVMILRETDPIAQAVRLAAHVVIQQDKQQAADAMRSGSR